MTLHVDQAVVDEMLGVALAEYSLIDGAIGMARTQIAQQEEHIALLSKKREASSKLITHLKTLKLRDPDRTPIPAKAPPPLATRSKNSRPPPPRRSGPPPLPHHKKK